MDFSSFNDVIGSIGTVLGIWSLVRGSEEVRAAFASLFKLFLPSSTTKQPKQVQTLSTKDTSTVFDSFFDKPDKVTLPSDVKQNPNKKMFDYLFILAILIIIPLALNFLATRPVSPPEPESTVPPIDWASSGGMNILSLFWMFVFLFGVIGAIRGWAKELLVIFSITVALTINLLLVKYLPFLSNAPENSVSLFWVQVIAIIILGYFGYQTVSSISAVREKLADSLYGTVFGGINGYFIAGSLLAYFHKAGYPYQSIIAPATDPNFLEKINTMMAFMPPNLLGEPGIYFAVIVLFVFIIFVYV
jgi:uncharacterized membrane protein required for colicin V production